MFVGLVDKKTLMYIGLVYKNVDVLYDAKPQEYSKVTKGKWKQ